MDKSVFFSMTYGMFVLGAKDKGRDVGCFVNTVIQLTSEPMQVAVSVNKSNYTNKILKETKLFTVSILSEETNPQIIGTFGFKHGNEIDKFEGLQTDYINGIPYLKEKCCGFLSCEVVNSIDCGTHDLFVCKVKDGEKLGDYTPMTYSYYHKVVKGKAPKTAPTYIDVQDDVMDEYKCSICGYVYEGEKGAFEKLPEDYKCPICGYSKEVFKLSH